MAISSVRLGSTLDFETVKPSKMETTRPSGASEAKETSSSGVKAINTGGALLDLPEIQVIPTVPSEQASRTTKESPGADSNSPDTPDVTAQKTAAPMEAKEETTATPFVLSGTPGVTAQKTAAPMEAKEETTATPFVLSDTSGVTAQKTAAPMETQEETMATPFVLSDTSGVTAQKTAAPMETQEETTAAPFVLSDTPGVTAQKTAAPMETQEETTATPVVLPDIPGGSVQETAMPMAEIPSTEAIPQPVQMQQTALPPVVLPPQVNPFAVYPPGTVVVILPQGGNGAELNQTVPPTAFYGQPQPMMTQPTAAFYGQGQPMYWPSSPQLDPLLEQARQMGAIPIPPAIQAGDVMPGSPLLPMPPSFPAAPGGGASNLPTWSQGLYSDILNTYFGGVIPPGGADYTAGLRFA